MSKDWYQDIINFHKKAEQMPCPFSPHIPDRSIAMLRRLLINEEWLELSHALAQGNLTEIADGITDVIVVLIGTAIAYGIDLRPIWNEVHKTNMAKMSEMVIKSPTGKVLKPSGWTPPDIKGILAKQGG